MRIKNVLFAAAAVCITATASYAATVTETFRVSSAVGSGNDHSLWISGGVGNGIGSDFDFSPDGTLTFSDDGSGMMTGRVQSQNDANSGFQVSFNFSDMFPQNASPAFKVENNSTFTTDLRLIDMTGGTLMGFGALDGLDLDVTRKPSDYSFATQMGSKGASAVGPNNKNGNFGLAFWMEIGFAQSCTICNQYSNLNGKQADINVDLAAVPLPAGGLLMISALGGALTLRRRRKG